MLILTAKTKDFKSIVIYQSDLGLDADNFYVTQFVINGDTLLSKVAKSIIDQAGVAYRYFDDYQMLKERNVDLNSINQISNITNLSSLLHLASSTPSGPFSCAACHQTVEAAQGTTNIGAWAASPLQCTFAASSAGIFPPL